jgi:mRNA-degrading endonuclease toxin of MazEF toxin-antitoxin module
MSAPLRGQVYRADIGFGPKPWLVVSNNHRNRALSDLLAVRITITERRANLQPGSLSVPVTRSSVTSTPTTSRGGVRSVATGDYCHACGEATNW